MIHTFDEMTVKVLFNFKSLRIESKGRSVMIIMYQIFMINKQRRESLGKFYQDSNMSIEIMSLSYNQSVYQSIKF